MTTERGPRPSSVGARGSGGDDRCRPLRLLPPRLVPLNADQERQAVEALAGLLAGLLARQAASWGDAGAAGHPDDPEAA